MLLTMLNTNSGCKINQIFRKVSFHLFKLYHKAVGRNQCG